MFLRPFCSPSLACAKFPGARLRRLPDERPSSRIPSVVNHPARARARARAREGHSPPTRSHRQKSVLCGEKYYIIYVYSYNNNNDDSIQFFFFIYILLLLLLYSRHVYEIGGNVSSYTTGFVSTSCRALTS